jgi:predicted acylesterase/phospholipase RssA
MSTTLPYVSINDGSLFGERIKATLGATQIEDLPGPKFFCVSSNITDGALAVHYTGSLWGFVRASMSIIGVLPPVLAKDTGRLLVDGGYASNLPVDVMHVLLPNSVGLTLACDVERKNMVRELELLTAKDYNDGGMGAQAVAQELSGSWLLRRALARSLCGFQYNVPHMFTLFQEVGFLRHYSAMRILFHGSLGGISFAPSPVNFDPTRHEPARSPRSAGGSPASRPRARSGGSDSGADMLEGEGGGGGGEEEDEDEDEDALSPKLVYIRPDVGDFAILDYAKVGVIEAKGAAAAKRCLDRYTSAHWRAPSNIVPC